MTAAMRWYIHICTAHNRLHASCISFMRVGYVQKRTNTHTHIHRNRPEQKRRVYYYYIRVWCKRIPSNMHTLLSWHTLPHIFSQQRRRPHLRAALVGSRLAVHDSLVKCQCPLLLSPPPPAAFCSKTRTRARVTNKSCSHIAGV